MAKKPNPIIGTAKAAAQMSADAAAAVKPAAELSRRLHEQLLSAMPSADTEKPDFGAIMTGLEAVFAERQLSGLPPEIVRAEILEITIAEAMQDPKTAAELAAGRFPLTVREVMAYLAASDADANLSRQRAAHLHIEHERLRAAYPGADPTEIEQALDAWAAIYDRMVNRMRAAIVGRYRSVLMHPLAADHWDAALELARDDSRTVPEAVAVLEALSEKPQNLN